MAGYITYFYSLSLKIPTAVICSVLWQLSQNIDCSSPLLQEPSKLRAFFTCARVLSVCIFAFWGKAVLCMNFPSSSFLLWKCICLRLLWCHGYNIILSFAGFLLRKRDWAFIKYKGSEKWNMKVKWEIWRMPFHKICLTTDQFMKHGKFPSALPLPWPPRCSLRLYIVYSLLYCHPQLSSSLVQACSLTCSEITRWSRYSVLDYPSVPEVLLTQISIPSEIWL